MLCKRNTFFGLRNIFAFIVNSFCSVWEILFYEKYLLLSVRVGVYFHPGAVKSRQSASCSRQPILNPILSPFQKITFSPARFIHVYHWARTVRGLFELIAFPMFKSRTVLPDKYLQTRFELFQILCKGNGSNQSELAIINSVINAKLFTPPRSF